MLACPLLTGGMSWSGDFAAVPGPALLLFSISETPQLLCTWMCAFHHPAASSLGFCHGPSSPRASSLALSFATKGCRTTIQGVVLPSDLPPPWVLECLCGMEQLSISWHCALVFFGVTWSCASPVLGSTTCHCAMSLCCVIAASHSFPRKTFRVISSNLTC